MNRVVLAVVAAGAFAVSGCGVDQIAGDAATPPPSSSVTPTNDPAAEAAASALGPLLESGFPQTYAGVRLDGDRVVVHRLPDRALDDAARAAAHGVRLALVDAKFPLSRLKEVTDRIAADAEHWKTTTVRISTWGPAVDGSAVDVTTADGSEADRAALAERYGADVIRVSKGDLPTPAPAPATK
ncbi:hypothetical protein [Actinosynnema sp. NPDC023587]|uniref:hypothetical protein n=1 Tax=Actinosynnema sp. NPDC023587 TaxID=3154695 RepID=UPI0034074FDA